MSDKDIKIIRKRDDEIPVDSVRLYYSNEGVRAFNSQKIYAVEELHEVGARENKWLLIWNMYCQKIIDYLRNYVAGEI